MALRTIGSRLATVGARVRAAPKATLPFYQTQDWRRLAERIKRERGYVCENPDCGRTARGRGLIADHVVELVDGGAALDPRNIRVLCAACHQIKTAGARRERGGGG